MAQQSSSSDDKKFGIRITLTPGNPMRAEHLLGPDWESFRWYATEKERDEALEDVNRHLPNYRRGDRQAQVAEKFDR